MSTEECRANFGLMASTDKECREFINEKDEKYLYAYAGLSLTILILAFEVFQSFPQNYENEIARDVFSWFGVMTISLSLSSFIIYGKIWKSHIGTTVYVKRSESVSTTLSGGNKESIVKLQQIAACDPLVVSEFSKTEISTASLMNGLEKTIYLASGCLFAQISVLAYAWTWTALPVLLFTFTVFIISNSFNYYQLEKVKKMFLSSIFKPGIQVKTDPLDDQ